MFAQLIRHEARLQLRPLLVMTGFAALVVGLAALFVYIDQGFLSTLGVITGTAALIAYPLAVFAYLVASYYRSMYGRQGYFTMSIPVDGATLYWAKFCWAWLVGVVAAAITVGFKVFQMWVDDALARSKQDDQAPSTLGQLWALLAENASLVVLIGILMLLLVASYVATWGFVVTAGAGPRLNRLGAGGPAVMGALTYVALQLVLFVSIVAVPFGLVAGGGELKIVGHNFLTDLASGASTSVMPLGWVPALMLVGAVLIWWTINAIRHRTSLR